MSMSSLSTVSSIGWLLKNLKNLIRILFISSSISWERFLAERRNDFCTVILAGLDDPSLQVILDAHKEVWVTLLNLIQVEGLEDGKRAAVRRGSLRVGCPFEMCWYLAGICRASARNDWSYHIRDLMVTTRRSFRHHCCWLLPRKRWINRKSVFCCG